ncbi:MAG: GNAT family N-acetyltransferase, partial [Casimicrobium sp.]
MNSLDLTATTNHSPIQVRRASRTDAPKIADLCSSQRVYDSFLGMPFLHSELWSDLCGNTWDLPLVLVAENSADTELLGVATLLSNGKNRRQTHIGIVSVAVSPRAHRQGIGKLLLGRIVSCADAYYQITRLEAVIWTENIASKRLFEK